MRRRLTRPFLAAAAALLASAALAASAALVALAAAPAVSAAASPVQDPVPIGPNEYFTGLVNHHPPGLAPIYVVCPGPITVGETGHPLAGQPVEVEPGVSATTMDLGYTGSAGDSITAVLATPVSAIILGSFRSYFVPVNIPTGIRVPCYGSGTVAFIPSPGSPTARAATLTVTFVNIAA
jgi:hypothetical protein